MGVWVGGVTNYNRDPTGVPNCSKMVATSVQERFCFVGLIEVKVCEG